MAQTMPPLIRRAEARGIIIGEQRGIGIGEQKGKRDSLLRLMQKKYGPLPAGIRTRIEQVSDSEQLDHLIEAVLSASTLAEMPLSD